MIIYECVMDKNGKTEFDIAFRKEYIRQQRLPYVDKPFVLVHLDYAWDPGRLFPDSTIVYDDEGLRSYKSHFTDEQIYALKRRLDTAFSWIIDPGSFLRD